MIEIYKTHRPIDRLDFDNPRPYWVVFDKLNIAWLDGEKNLFVDNYVSYFHSKESAERALARYQGIGAL